MQCGKPGALRYAWQEVRFKPLLSNPTATELLRTLACPKFKLFAVEQKEHLADYLPWCEIVSIPVPPPATPIGSDLSDQSFLRLAVAGTADFLVTGDGDLLALASEFSSSLPKTLSLLNPLTFLL